MAEDWTTDEIVAATRSYMWMRRSQLAGYNPVKSRVNAALVAGPLKSRTKLDYRFQNISAVLQEMRMPWVEGFLPRANVGPKNAALIKEAVEAYLNGPKSTKRVSALVQALPPETVEKAAQELAAGAEFNFPDSTTYDVEMGGGQKLAPKRVIGYAALLHYGAPLLSVDFAGGLGSFAFERLEAAGLTPIPKSAPPKPQDTESEAEILDAEEFQQAVEKIKKRGFKAPPTGNKNPPKTITTSVSFKRDPKVVAFVELRANGICELCGKDAPFIRANGDRFLEVHHIRPLSENGPDTVENAAALCPNCHRECHHGSRKQRLQQNLIERVATLASKSSDRRV
jgi:hypothetical protein